MKESTRTAIQRARNLINDDTVLHREARGILYGILKDKDEMSDDSVEELEPSYDDAKHDYEVDQEDERREQLKME